MESCSSSSEPTTTPKVVKACIDRLKIKGYPLHDIDQVIDTATDDASLIFISKIMSPYQAGQYVFNKSSNCATVSKRID